jgi:poly(beta-D-mannuronate) lyase
LLIGSYYTDAHYSVIDEAKKREFDAIQEPFTRFGRGLAAAADNYRETGSRAAAQCVISLLARAAKDRALAGHMESFQAYYEQGWSLSSWAIAYLKVRGAELATPGETEQIQKWLQRMAESTRNYYDSHRSDPGSDAHNNHLYWAGLAISAAGIAGNDQKLFDWGVETYREGIGAITPEGTLPAEMARAGRALHYHVYALGALILLAEFGEANGIDLYAEKGFAVKRLAARCVAGLQDTQFFEKETGVPQVPEPLQGEAIGWAQPYARRFPDEQLAALLAKAEWLNYTTWGGLPPE